MFQEKHLISHAVLCYRKNKQLVIKDSLLCPWGKTALTFSLNSSRDDPEIFILL